MEKPAVHRGAVQHSQCPAKGVGQDGFTAEFGNNLLEVRSDLSESLVPGNPLPFWCGAGALARGSRSFRPYPPYGIQNPIRRIHPIQILRDFCAKEATRHGMRRITLDLGRAAVLYGNQNSAGIRAVVRTGSVDYILHDFLIIEWLTSSPRKINQPQGTRSITKVRAPLVSFV